MSKGNVLLLVLAIAFLVPVMWHGEVQRKLTLFEFSMAYTKWGHPRSPHRIWDVNTGEWGKLPAEKQDNGGMITVGDT